MSHVLAAALPIMVRVEAPCLSHRPRFLPLVLGLVLLIGSLPLLPASVPSAAAQTAGPACRTSGPQDGAYEAEVCLTATWSEGAQTGDVQVSATVEGVSGTVPETAEFEFGLARGRAESSFDILTDYAAPFTFTLPTDRFVDGTYRIVAEAEFVDDYDADEAELTLTFANGVRDEPTVADTWEPSTGRPGLPFVLAAVGDGAGGLPGADAVGDLITGWDPNLLLYLGDVYNAGTYTEFVNYYEPTLGGLNAITNPVPGNHEAGGAGFRGYFEYWDTFEHYYAVDVAGWHLVGLDTTGTYGQIRPGDSQYEWLAQDLAAHAGECTIVFFHHPRFGLGNTAGNPDLQAVWELLAAHDVEIALAGHEHNYQRWQPLNGAGQVDPGGVTQFVVGTGGHELEGFRAADARVASAVEDRDGALRVELTTSGAEFEFLASDGAVLDSGSITCAVPGAITLDQAESTTESWVVAELTNFTPGSEIVIRWEDNRVLRTVRADSTGRARVSFHTPSAPYGSHVVTAEDASGLRSTTRLSIIPRVKLTRETVPLGADLRVYLYGFAADQFVEVHLAHEDGTTSDVLGTVTTDSQGSARVRITIPATWHPGASTVVAHAASDERLNAAASIVVTR